MYRELKREAYEANIALPQAGPDQPHFRQCQRRRPRPRRVRHQAQRRGLRRARPGRHGGGRFRRPASRAAAPVVRHADPPPALAGLPDIGGVVHTHSTHATAFAQAGRRDPDLRHDARRLLCGNGAGHPQDDAGEIAAAYEWETGNVIVERFGGARPADYPGVLVNRHAPFTWGARWPRPSRPPSPSSASPQMAMLSPAPRPRPRGDRAGAARQALPAQARPRRLLRPARGDARTK